MLDTGASINAVGHGHSLLGDGEKYRHGHSLLCDGEKYLPLDFAQLRSVGMKAGCGINTN
jgi:hypothetical protein